MIVAGGWAFPLRQIAEHCTTGGLVKDHLCLKKGIGAVASRAARWLN